ncbi:MAG: vitamin B12-dependent ribonucleotide reductase [Pseudonocardiaceae bacterium]|nr:vitamin B12-dependent ribonucleotide reductase [Pseudonocardiaceae bacterium]
MSETVGTAAAESAGGGQPKRALRVERVYTTEGRHPYDEVTWERRDVVMTNWRDGTVNFEQRGVEFPDFWSVNAVNIVTSKYFRGAPGTEARESSLRQLIDRVVGVYTAAGLEHGYFGNETDAEIFSHELTWMLLHQVFSFNSPVWFNVGTSSPQQVSACQPYDALVSTPGGMVPIGHLAEQDAVGTKVYDAHGLTRVMATKSNGVKDVLRIHTKAGHRLDVTADHLVWRSSGEGCGRFVPAGELRSGDKLEWHRRSAFGGDEIDSRTIAEAALAGWLQADGFVGQYTGTNRSLTIEAMTVTDAELAWVSQALDQVFPDVHRHERCVATQDTSLDCRRTRLYGTSLGEFVERWGLRARGTDMWVPQELFNAPLPVVAAYLRSLFQAEGYVSPRGRSTLVGLSMIGEELVRGIQALLARFGIFARVGRKIEKRADRHDLWGIRIQSAGDRRLFADEIGFIDPVKAGKLEVSFDLPGQPARDVKQLQIARIEQRGAMEVYDIQTESGEYLSSNLRVHNCFILSVDDTMESILNWYREEGLIFKGGSGAGLNLSRIRSSKELLSSGGTASGPVSFMRGADASAGTIKSGGATRRAAKMVVLDVDHPDIGEFVETKAAEERKIKVLRDAGYDMDLGGKDSTSVQYQNANNSVRVSDEFMRAVETDGEFGLRTRMTGEVVETVRAKDLFRDITQAAWECADPGLQYDDTINDWHTCPESGRITASNPCSEFLHLDNSSCNLASINLMKFLREDLTFDAELFTKTVELITTAMDISICFADFPTEKITEVTRAFRQLGIGYANLGALLMATGHAYDSDGGRALAASITSLMTGTAYKRSAELAGVVGPYEGYDRNAAPHQRVMRKHAAANDLVRTYDHNDSVVQKAAARVWQESIRTGERQGWRNAQASVIAPTGTISFMLDSDTTGIEPDFSLVKYKKLVGGGSMQIVNQTVPKALASLGYQDEQSEAIVEYIAEHGHVIDAPGLRPEHYSVFDCAMGERAIAPMGHVRMMAAAQPFVSGAISKCVIGETLVTTEDGLVRIGSLHQGEDNDSFRPEVVKVGSLGGPRKTDAFYYGGTRPVREVELRSGHRLSGTLNHRLMVATSEGPVWRPLAEIRAGDYVALQYGNEMWSTLSARIDNFTPSARYGCQKEVRIPDEMTEELAFLLGAYAAEGHTSEGTWSVVITNSVDVVLERVAAACRYVFGIEPRFERRSDRCPQVIISSKTVVEFLRHLGCGGRASQKRIPDVVLQSPREMVLAFLQGLALDGYVHVPAGRRTGQAKWALCVDSSGLLDDLQAVLTNLGVVHGRVDKLNKENGKTYGEVYASGEQARRLSMLVPFVEPDKEANARRLRDRSFAHSTADVIPGLSGPQLYEGIPESRRNSFRHLLDLRTHNVSRRTVERLAEIPGVLLPAWVVEALRDNLRFSPVDHVDDDIGDSEVYDISVPDTHAFVGNGIVNHNTVNMPERATVAEVAEIYFQSWKMGLKALAIYRDNCKVGQPLSTGKSSASTTEVDKAVAEARPIRKRLPKKRPSETVSFAVAGAEGYLTAGSYPDDGLGEIFVKMSKQGSTLAGVMDAFSMAISIALQYGVPLETYVSKFVNMRFEPAGMTDDPDIRMATSVVDYLFRRIALDYLPYEKRAQLGIFSAEERTAAVNGDQGSAKPDEEVDVEGMRISVDSTAVLPPVQQRPAPVSVGSSTELLELQMGKAADAPLCLTCGTKMRPAGSCYVCEGCGSTSGCS